MTPAITHSNDLTWFVSGVGQAKCGKCSRRMKLWVTYRDRGVSGATMYRD